MSVKFSNGEFMRRSTLKEVAAEAGVSVATVSNAYNRPDQLSPDLRRRVLEVAKDLGYSGPDPMGRSLRRRRAGAIGVLYSDRLSYAFADPAAVMFFEGVSVATEEAGLGMLLLPGSTSHGRDPEAVGNAMVDGFVVYCMAEDDPLVRVVVDRKMPMVLVDHPGGKDVLSIGIDDEGAAKSVAEHLLNLGHRRIAVISLEQTREPKGGLTNLQNPDRATYLPSRSRLQGYAKALESPGLSLADIPVYECAEGSPEQGAQAAKTLLRAEDTPTAILCMSDQLALGVMEALRSIGLSVPKDVSVAGFDDVPEAARAVPALTTIRQPHVEKGLLAGRMLISQISGDVVQNPDLLTTRLVVRNSTAPPKERE